MSNTKFPKFLYVVEDEGDSESEPCLLANADPSAHAELNARITVGKYQFIEQGEVSARAVYTGDDE